MMSEPAFSSAHSQVSLLCPSTDWTPELQRCLRTQADTALEYLLPKHPAYSAQTFDLVLADDACLQRLNADWRAKDQPTNVLAFPALPLAGAPKGIVQTLGDVIIAFETARTEADTLNITLEEHSTHLMVHGLLHLLGYDHLNAVERHDMEDWEIRTMKRLGYRNPYE